MKKFFAILFAFAMSLSLVACGGSSAPEKEDAPPPEPLDLTGEWKQNNSESEDSWQAATIKDGVIEVYWIGDKGETSALYWAGSYVAPTEATDSYSWDSVNDTEKTKMALMASGDETKTFTYDNNELSYSVSAFGVTTTVKLSKQ